MHHAFINIQSYSRKLNLANFLWNLADISKLRGSSGQDYLICNSHLKTPVGFPNHCYRKEMFRIPQFYNSKRSPLNLIIITHLQYKTMLRLDQSSSWDKEQSTCTTAELCVKIFARVVEFLREVEQRERGGLFEMKTVCKTLKIIIFYKAGNLIVS